MKNWPRPFLSFCLICYLAVSSIAAIHAFPVSNIYQSSNQQIGMGDSSSSVELTTMPCHQMLDNTSPQERESDNNSVSACEIFCAVIGLAIPHDCAHITPLSSVATETVFIQPKFYKGDHSLEPHPPK